MPPAPIGTVWPLPDCVTNVHDDPAFTSPSQVTFEYTSVNPVTVSTWWWNIRLGASVDSKVTRPVSIPGVRVAPVDTAAWTSAEYAASGPPGVGSSTMEVPSATAPPAELPTTAMRSASAPSSAAFARIHRTDSMPSSIALVAVAR